MATATEPPPSEKGACTVAELRLENRTENALIPTFSQLEKEHDLLLSRIGSAITSSLLDPNARAAAD